MPADRIEIVQRQSRTPRPDPELRPRTKPLWESVAEALGFGDNDIESYELRQMAERDAAAAEPAVTGLESQIPGGNPETPTPLDAVVGIAASMGGLPPGIARSGQPALRRPTRSAEVPAAPAMVPPSSDVILARRKRGADETRKLVANLLRQLQDTVANEPVGAGLFTDRGTKTDVLMARLSPETPEGGALANFGNTGWASESMKKSPEFPLGWLLRVVNELRVDPYGIVSHTKNPTEFTNTLISTIAHEIGMHSLKDSGPHPDSSLWKTPDRYKQRSLGDVPPLAQTTHPEEFTNQVRMDVMRDRILRTPLAQALLETSSDPSSPIAQTWAKLR